VPALAGRRNVLVLVGLALVVLPALANPYILYVANIALIYVILAVGLNLLLGYAGQFAFANAALFGIGAYATGLLQVRLGLPFWISFPAAVVITTLIGLVVALPALRLSGLYLALVTLAFAQFTQWLMLNWERVTFGAGGFKVSPLTFGPLPPAQATPTATPQVQTVDDGSTGRNILFIVGGVLIVGFAVMGWFILRDARGALGEPELAGPRLREQGPHKHKMQAKAKARKKTHAQKAARKAHRKR